MSTHSAIHWLVATTVTVLTWAALAVGQEPVFPKNLGSGAANILSVNVRPHGLVGLTLASEREGDRDRPVICYGLHRFNNKSRYTYFILLKTDRTKKWDLGGASVGIGAPHDINVKGFFTFDFGCTFGQFEKMYAHVGDRKSKKTIEVWYKFKVDEKTGALQEESLKVNGKDYDKDGPRVFLVDLTQDKITCTPLKVALPDQVPNFDAGNTSEVLIRALRQLAEKTPEVKEMFGGKREK